MADSTLRGHDDWSNIVLNFLSFGDSLDGPINPVPDDDPFPTLAELVAAEVELGFLLEGDTDFDNDVDFADFLTLSANFGTQEKVWWHGDFTGDGEVGFADFLLLSGNFGKKLPPQQQPGNLAALQVDAIRPAPLPEAIEEVFAMNDDDDTAAGWPEIRSWRSCEAASEMWLLWLIQRGSRIRMCPNT